MSDLDLKFSESGIKKNTNSLDLKLNNGQFEEVKTQKAVPVEVEKPKPFKEEYFESLLDEKAEVSEVQEELTEQLADEIFEEIAEAAQEEISDGQAFEETEEVEEAVEQSTVSQLADEIFEEIVEEAEAEETEEVEADEPNELGNEGEIIAVANEPAQKTETDEILGELAKDTRKGKYDFINLCVLAIMVLFLGLTFIFMKQSLSTDDGVEFTAETVKTGEYTKYLSEKYVEKMPLEKIVTQANVLMRKIFGKTDLEFVVFKDNEPPDGPIDNNDIGGISAGDSMTPDMTVTTVVTTPEATTTTPKIVQDFEVTTPKEEVSDSGIFTGRPIKTTTTKVTTTLDLPKTTDETTTGKVNLIFPE